MPDPFASAFRPKWVFHAFKEGRVVPFHATQNGNLLPLFPRYFQEPFTSEWEALDAAALRLRTDPEFAARWWGYLLMPLDVNKAIVVNKIPGLRVPEIVR